jgi:hypothetical protein
MELAVIFPFSLTKLNEPTVIPFFTKKFLLDKIHFPLVWGKKKQDQSPAFI